MIDIFDIINTRKTKRINIEGTINENYLTVFPVRTLDELCDTIESFINSIEVNTLSIESYDVFSSDHDYYFNPRNITIDISRPKKIAKEFKIDIKLTDEAYNIIYKRFEDFIDYYTVGAIHSRSCHISSSDLGSYSLYSTLDAGLAIDSVLIDENIVYSHPIITGGRRH